MASEAQMVAEERVERKSGSISTTVLAVSILSLLQCLLKPDKRPALHHMKINYKCNISPPDRDISD